MFTLSLLYTVFYLFIMLALLVFSFVHVPFLLVTHLSTTNFIVFISKYVPTRNLFFFLLFSLTGLPPVGLFFIKFNIFSFVLYQTHIFTIICLFLLFLLNMLFYTQLFNFKNFKKQSYTVINTKVFTYWNTQNFTNSHYTSYNFYKLNLMIVNILLLLFTTFLFFSDYFLIVAL